MEREYGDLMNHQKKRLKPVHGILLFVLVMVSYYTIIAWMQIKFGMYGLAMTELYLLLLSVGITALCGADFAEVFPVRKPSWSKNFRHTAALGRSIRIGAAGDHGDRMAVS